MKLNKTIMSKVLLGIVVGSIFVIMTGCSSNTKVEEKAYEAIREYQEELYSDSNKILEIEYPDLKDIDEDNIIEGKSQYGNDTLKIKGTYTYNHEKMSVDSGESDEEANQNQFEAVVEMYDDKYNVIRYDEEINVRLLLDDDPYFN